MEKLKNKKGFTMVELLVSMAIIGLLIATAIWGIGLAQQSARNTQRRTAGSMIVAGFAEYYSRFNKQPKAVSYVSAGTVRFSQIPAVAATNYDISGFSGIMDPKVAANYVWDETNGTPVAVCTGMKGDTTQTKYIVGYVPTKGMRVCVCLEGASEGSANLSADPAGILCP